jgi:predicted acyltransferase
MIRLTTSVSSLQRPALPTVRRLPVEAAPTARPAERLLSLDVMRGFTMFWIVGGAEIVIAVVACVSPAWGDALTPQSKHALWRGFACWDMIMPVFLFVVGASMPFALAKRWEQGAEPRTFYWRIARRFAILWILGMIAQGSLLKWHFGQLEFYSNTLQAIAVGYAVTAVALLHLRPWMRVVLFGSLVLAYWALLALVPFGGHPAGTLEQEANFALYVDQTVLGRFRRDHHFTWIITSLGFVATVLLGSLAGQLLRLRRTAGEKLAALTAIGAVLMAAGWVWSYWQPINRHIWTSSLILWTGGFSFLLLALFHGVVDVAGYKRWTFPFVVIGANSLLAYMISQVYDRTLSDVLVGNLAKQWSAPYDELLRAAAAFTLLWLILWYAYRNRSFLRA